VSDLSPRPKSRRRPLAWLGDATVEEIAEALLAVDPVKAAQVAAYVASRAGISVGNRLELAARRVSRDPLGSIGKMLGSLGD